MRSPFTARLLFEAWRIPQVHDEDKRLPIVSEALRSSERLGFLLREEWKVDTLRREMLSVLRPWASAMLDAKSDCVRAWFFRPFFENGS